MMVMLEQRRWKTFVFLEEREQQRHLHCLGVLLRLDHRKFVQALTTTVVSSKALRKDPQRFRCDCIH